MGMGRFGKEYALACLGEFSKNGLASSNALNKLQNQRRKLKLSAES